MLRCWRIGGLMQDCCTEQVCHFNIVLVIFVSPSKQIQ